MTRRALALVSLLAAGAAARAQGVDEPERPPEQPAPASDQLDIGIDILGGLATLGTLASCRSLPFEQGDPVLLGYSLQGKLVDDEADLRAFLDELIVPSKKGKHYTEDNCGNVRRALDALRYRATIREIVKEGGVELAVVLRPVIQVRRVDIAGNLTWPWEGQIFEEEIRRHLRLRPGAVLEDEDEARRRQLQEDENRVQTFLARRGFFEAHVSVTADVDAEHYEAIVDVDLVKGPAYTVGEIQVTGNASVPDDHIRAALEQRVCAWNWFCLWKTRFSADQLKEDRDAVIKDYQEEHGFPGVRVRIDFDPATSPDRNTKTVRLQVKIEERKRIEVLFEGNVEKAADELKRYLTFNAEGAYDDFEAQASADAIRRSYQQDGFFQCTVRWERVRLPGDYEQILFIVDEGTEQRIENIIFRGNRAFPDDELRKHIQSQEYPTIDWLPVASGGYLTSAQLEQDIKGLLVFYQSQGFPRVRATAQVANNEEILDEMGATAAQVTAADRDRRLYIRFDIEEGPREVVKEIEIAGARSAATDEEIAAVLRMIPGQPFTPPGVEEDALRLVRLFQQKGHLNVQVTSERVGEQADLRVRYVIRQGPPVRVGRVAVRGNFKTARWVVLDNLGFENGELLTLDELDQGQSRLQSTGLFVPRLVRLGRDRVSFVVNVEERFDRFADAELNVGYATDVNAFVAANLGINNIGGVGVAFLGSGEVAAKPRYRIDGTLQFPTWLMRRAIGLGLKLDLSGRYRLEDTPRFGFLETIGAGAALSRTLSDGVILSLKYDWNRFARSVDLIRPPGIDINLSQARITTLTASLGPALIVERRRPQPFAPVEGYSLSASLAWAATVLGGSNNFIKLGLAGQIFFPLGKYIVVANSLRYDQGFPLGGEVLLPDVERFSAGGDTSVRGFEEDRLKTEIIRAPLDPSGSVQGFRVVPAGGNIRVIHKLDLELRVWELAQWPVATAIFLDTGLITNSWSGFQPGHLRHSLGVAFFRWRTPGGSLSVEYAFPLDPELGDNPLGQFHFNVGFSF